MYVITRRLDVLSLVLVDCGYSGGLGVASRGS